MGEAAFIPGFVYPLSAAEAGQRFFRKADGRRGVKGVDFHLVQNERGRWHFEPGPEPKKETSNAR